MTSNNIDSENVNIDYKAEYEKYKMRYNESQLLVNEYKELLDGNRYTIRNLKETNEKLKKDYNNVVNSRGYKVVKLYYRICEFLMPMGSRRRKFLKKLLYPVYALLGKKEQKTVFEGDLVSKTPEEIFNELKSSRKIDIVTTPHTGYIAKHIQSMLDKINIECDIHYGNMVEYEKIPYIIVCPQFLKKFPETYVVFQMEQTIDERWMTEEYFEILEKAYAIFDYSFVNIEYFKKHNSLASKLYYLPVDYYSNLMGPSIKDVPKEYDVLFYGSPFVERRKNILDKLGKKFNLKIQSDLFGEDVYKEIAKAKVVVNIHFYENALLETTRLYETLSAGGAVIVSERSCDPKEEQRLENIVDFVDVGNIDALMDRVAYWVENENARIEKVKVNSGLLNNRANAAEYYFYSFLLANEHITKDTFNKIAGDFTADF